MTNLPSEGFLDASYVIIIMQSVSVDLH